MQLSLLQLSLFFFQRSPSSFNLQPTQIVLVRDTKRKQRLASNAMIGPGNEYRTRDCSTLAVFLSDLQASKRIERIQSLQESTTHPNYRATFPIRAHFLLGQGSLATSIKQAALGVARRTLKPMPTIDPIAVWGAKNTALVVQSYVLAATSHGLATTIMEGYDSVAMAQELRLPEDDRYSIPMVVATGYDYFGVETRDQESVRLGVEEVVFAETFGVPVRLGEHTIAPTPKTDSLPTDKKAAI